MNEQMRIRNSWAYTSKVKNLYCGVMRIPRWRHVYMEM